MKYFELKPGDMIVDKTERHSGQPCLVISNKPPTDKEPWYRIVWLTPYGIGETNPSKHDAIPTHYRVVLTA